MPQFTLRYDTKEDKAVWAAIQAIEPGQRSARLKQMIAAGLGLGDDVLTRLTALETRMAQVETRMASGLAPDSPPPIPSSNTAGQGFLAGLKKIGALDDGSTGG